MKQPPKKQPKTADQQPESNKPRQIATLHGPTLTYVDGKLTVQDGNNQIPLVPFEEPPENRPGYLTLREAAKRYAAFIDPASPAVQIAIARKTLSGLISDAKSGVISIVHRSRLLPVEQCTHQGNDYLAECRVSFSNALTYFVEQKKADQGMLESHFPDATLSPTPPEISQKPIEEIRKRRALKKEVEIFWPSIERDLQDGSRNGLSQMARAEKNTFWKVREALTWASQQGKLVKQNAITFVSSNPESGLSPMLRLLLKLD